MNIAKRLIIFTFLLITACSNQKDYVWQSVDGQPINQSLQQQATAICQAAAQNASNGIQAPAGSVSQRTTVSQTVTINTPAPGPAYNNVEMPRAPTSYGPPPTDFGSQIGEIGGNIAIGLQRREAYRSNFIGCMAQRGFVATSP